MDDYSPPPYLYLAPAPSTTRAEERSYIYAAPSPTPADDPPPPPPPYLYSRFSPTPAYDPPPPPPPYLYSASSPTPAYDPPPPPPPYLNSASSPTPAYDPPPLPPPYLYPAPSPTPRDYPPPPLPPTSTPSGGGLARGTLAAMVAGIVISAVLVAVAIFVIVYKRRKGKLAVAAQNLPAHEPKNDPCASRIVSGKPVPPPLLGGSLGNFNSTFTYEELKTATDDFSEANLLGEGSFGYVHKGVLADGKVVAIKQLKAGSEQGEREFRAEIEIISRVHHRHLVSLVGYCIFGAQRLLVYEFVPNKTLYFHLHGKERPVMDWRTRMKIASGSARGLAYLHEDCQPKIIHRDIKSANILLDNSFEAKVADFGLAKHFSDTDTHVSTRVMGTFGYLAPEYATSGKLTEKSDVYSFGVMLLELITGFRPMDKTRSFVDNSLVDWAKPLLAQALLDGNFDAIADPKLQEYDSAEMARMAACALASVRHPARRRPRMSQIIRALEGNMHSDDLNNGIPVGQNSVYGSYGSSDYNSMQHKEDTKKFRKMVLEIVEHGSSDYSGLTGSYGLNPSGSSTEDWQTTQEIEPQKT